ncbi:unnamed protein product [Mycena citricolor]|uniref:DUF6535 domain-containing protein n=1 Tax=Mycena citricolor TaxID=2018698 RepID=A0AAD2Q1T6_9AGAR|nr:unnamed protein product [Mycena citricolor]
MANNAEDARFSKLFSIYISEAEKYDKTLVDGWRSDMESMIIFAGLFSAVLTAFIIQSYQTLAPDNAAITAQLLAQISAQLASGSNATTAASLPPFTPDPSSLACNVLWFLSLGFSLGCALLATLVEQWARNFVQKVDMRPSPPIRARVYSFLYFGMKRFRMHDIVEVVPFLLHLSLFLFLAGLVLFLVTVNTAVMYLCVGILGLILVVYMTVTVLPLLCSDCPYQTPLTNACWNLALFLTRLSALGPAGAAPTMTERMVTNATAAVDTKRQRDVRALTWTVKSLVDDNELAPFIDALPAALSAKVVDLRSPLIVALSEDREARMVARVLTFLRSAMAANETQRCISAVKAVVALARIRVAVHDTSSPPSFLPFFARVHFESELGVGQLSRQLISSPTNGWKWLYTNSPSAALENYWRTMRALMLWSCAAEIQRALEDAERTFYQSNSQGNIAEIFRSRLGVFGRPRYPLPLPSLVGLWIRPPTIAVQSPDLFDVTRAELSDARLDLLCTYLLESLNQQELPYEFESCFELLQHDCRPPFSSQHQETVAKTIVTWASEYWKFSNAEHAALMPGIRFLVDALLMFYKSHGTASPLTESSLDAVDALLSFIGRHDASDRTFVIGTVLRLSESNRSSIAEEFMHLVTRYINESHHIPQASEWTLTGLWALGAWTSSSGIHSLSMGDRNSIARLESLNESAMAPCASISMTISHLLRIRSELNRVDPNDQDAVHVLYEQNQNHFLWPEVTAAQSLANFEMEHSSAAERYQQLSAHLQIRLGEATLATLARFITRSARHMVPDESSLAMRLFAENLHPKNDAAVHMQHRIDLVDSLSFFAGSQNSRNSLAPLIDHGLEAFYVYLLHEEVLEKLEARVRGQQTGHAMKQLEAILSKLRGMSDTTLEERTEGAT